MPQFHADAAIAAECSGRGEDQVAQAGQAGQRVATAAQGDRQARHFGQAARDQRGDGVGAEAQPGAHAGGDGDHVFHRAAEFDADDVVVGVEAKRRPGELFLHAAATSRMRGGDDHGRGVSARNFECESWARRARRDGARIARRQRRAITSVMRRREPCSRPFVALTKRCVRFPRCVWNGAKEASLRVNRREHVPTALRPARCPRQPMPRCRSPVITISSGRACPADRWSFRALARSAASTSAPWTHSESLVRLAAAAERQRESRAAASRTENGDLFHRLVRRPVAASRSLVARGRM